MLVSASGRREALAHVDYRAEAVIVQADPGPVWDLRQPVADVVGDGRGQLRTLGRLVRAHAWNWMSCRRR
jgi:hypothetical protein